MAVEIRQPPPQVAEVTNLSLDLDTLCARLERDLGTVGDPLLPALLVADNVVRQAKHLRTVLLMHARECGQSWAAISDATSVPPTTWRTRLRTAEGD
ncbi:MAG: hypothetical protein HOY78_02510 [Saccharothrix sp.]|nr:hypothetical protein [Saccharothrix sp.]